MSPTNAPKKSSTALWVVLGLVILIAIAAVVYYGISGSDTNSNTNTVANTNTSSNANANVSANVNTAGNQNTNSAATNTNTAANTNSSTNTNTAVDTSDWLTYTNTTHGFLFKYPSSSLVNEEGDQITVYDATDRSENIVLVVLEGELSDVINSVNAIQNFRVEDTSETSINGAEAFIIDVMQTAVNKSFSDIAISLSGGTFARITPYQLDPVSGFPASLEDQDTIFAIVNSFSLTR